MEGFNEYGLIKGFFVDILVSIDATLYTFISSLYGIFIDLANARIFGEEFFIDFTSRIYIIVGIIALFLVSYTLLQMIVNPEDSKSEGGKIAKRIVIAVILVPLVPVMFNFLYAFQDSVLSGNIIPNLILGEYEDVDSVIGYYASQIYVDENGNLCEDANSENCESKMKYFCSDCIFGESSENCATIDVDPNISTEEQIEVALQGCELQGKTLLTNTENVDTESLRQKYIGNTIAFSVMEGFMHPAPGFTDSTIKVDLDSFYDSNFIDNAIAGGIVCVVGGALAVGSVVAVTVTGGASAIATVPLKTIAGIGCATLFGASLGIDKIQENFGEQKTWESAKELILLESDFKYMAPFSQAIGDGEMSYTLILATLAAGFLAYMLISFCLDLGIRVAKLAFLQLIAPVPIFMSILPKNSDLLSNWVKITLTTFAEVFVRIIVMSVVAFMAASIVIDFTDNPLVNAIIIMGIIAFAKQLPKFLGDVTGIKSEGMKLGIKEKLAEGGFFVAGGAIGGAFKSGINNAAENFHNTKGGKLKKSFSALGGIAPGAVSGFLRGGRHGLSAKTYTDLVGAVGKGADEAEKSRDNKRKRAVRYKGEGRTAFQGRFYDAKDALSRWAGISSGVESLRKRKQLTEENVKSIEALGSNSDAILGADEIAASQNYWNSIGFETIDSSGTVTNSSATVSMRLIEDAIAVMKKGYDADFDYNQFENYFTDMDWQTTPMGNQTQLSQALIELEKRQKALKKEASRKMNMLLASGNATTELSSRGITLEGKTRGMISDHYEYVVKAADDMVANRDIMSTVISNLSGSDLTKVTNSATGLAYTAEELKVLISSSASTDKAKAAEIIAEYKKPYYDEVRRIGKVTQEAETKQAQKDQEKK